MFCLSRTSSHIHQQCNGAFTCTTSCISHLWCQQVFHKLIFTLRSFYTETRQLHLHQPDPFTLTNYTRTRKLLHNICISQSTFYTTTFLQAHTNTFLRNICNDQARRPAEGHKMRLLRFAFQCISVWRRKSLQHKWLTVDMAASIMGKLKDPERVKGNDIWMEIGWYMMIYDNLICCFPQTSLYKNLPSIERECSCWFTGMLRNQHPLMECVPLRVQWYPHIDSCTQTSHKRILIASTEC